MSLEKLKAKLAAETNQVRPPAIIKSDKQLARTLAPRKPRRKRPNSKA